MRCGGPLEPWPEAGRGSATDALHRCDAGLAPWPRVALSTPKRVAVRPLLAATACGLDPVAVSIRFLQRTCELLARLFGHPLWADDPIWSADYAVQRRIASSRWGLF